MKHQALFYSDAAPRVLIVKDRKRVARQIMGVINAYTDCKTGSLICLDIGSSTGVISYYLAKYFNRVEAIDVDKKAIDRAEKVYKRKNLRFLVMDAERMNYRKGSFDVVVLNQVYSFVENDVRLMNEVWRVLRKGGICFFSARNKFAIIEGQYNFPFLSWLPRRISNFIVKFFHLGNQFVGNYRSYSELRDLVKRFKVCDYTLKIIKDPEKFGFSKLRTFSKVALFVPLRLLYSFIPNYIWILQK